MTSALNWGLVEDLCLTKENHFWAAVKRIDRGERTCHECHEYEKMKLIHKTFFFFARRSQKHKKACGKLLQKEKKTDRLPQQKPHASRSHKAIFFLFRQRFERWMRNLWEGILLSHKDQPRQRKVELKCQGVPLTCLQSPPASRRSPKITSVALNSSWSCCVLSAMFPSLPPPTCLSLFQDD